MARRVTKKYRHVVSSRTLATIRKVDAQTDAINAHAYCRENAKNAARRAKVKKRPLAEAAMDYTQQRVLEVLHRQQPEGPRPGRAAHRVTPRARDSTR